MKHLITISSIILTLLFIGTGNAYCDTNMFLSNEGGTYKLIKTLNEYHNGNILLVASSSKPTNYTSDKVCIMTTALQNGTNYTGYFGSYIYGDYSSSMPDYITVNTVNKTQDNTTYPYEYQAQLKDASSYTIALRNINTQFIYYKNNSSTTYGSLALSEIYITNYNYNNLRLCQNGQGNRVYAYFNTSSMCLKCQNSGNGYFTNAPEQTQNNYNFAFFYKKVHPLHIGSTGYATLYNSKDSYLLPSGLTAYTYKLNDNKLEILTQRTDSIPRGVAVILKGTPNTDYELEVLAKSCAYGVIAAANNVLHGTDAEASTATAVSGDYAYYYLANGKKGLGFYYKATDGAAFSNGAHKAFLAIPKESQAKSLEFILPTNDEDITPIKTTTAEGITTPSLDNDCYDILGRRIAEPQHGTYIKQGKKYIK